MDPYEIIRKYYRPGSKAYKVLIAHSKAVTKKALQVAGRVPELKPDLQFIQEAAMLHDIGIIKTKAAVIGCFGSRKYIAHGIEGMKILEKEGLPRHAKVCERHIGVGLTAKDVIEQKLPLPKKMMTPRTTEEKIIAFADKFFSKDPHKVNKSISNAQIKARLARFGNRNVKTFERWRRLFKEKDF